MVNKQTAVVPKIKTMSELAERHRQNERFVKEFGDELKDMPRLWKKYHENKAAIAEYERGSRRWA